MANLNDLDLKICAKQTDLPELEGDTLVFVREKSVSITASRTLTLDDAEQFIVADSTSAVVVTIPTNAAVALPVGTEIAVLRKGTGTATITAASGVTLNGTSAGSKPIGSQYGTVALRKIDTDAWIIAGDI